MLHAVFHRMQQRKLGNASILFPLKKVLQGFHCSGTAEKRFAFPGQWRAGLQGTMQLSLDKSAFLQILTLIIFAPEEPRKPFLLSRLSFHAVQVN